jgi:hypothetical protein
VRTIFRHEFHIPKEEKIYILTYALRHLCHTRIGGSVDLHQVLKMFSMRFSARLDTFHYEPPHPFKDAWNICAGFCGLERRQVTYGHVIWRKVSYTLLIGMQELSQVEQELNVWRMSFWKVVHK